MLSGTGIPFACHRCGATLQPIICVRGRAVYFRAIIFLFLIVVLGGCAQDPDKVVVSVGRGLNAYSDGVDPNSSETRDYAVFYLPYAEMSALAKTKSKNLEFKGCPALNEANYPKDWTCIQGWHDEIPNTRFDESTLPVPGLGVSIWRRRDNRCELAVVFRGSDFDELADWKANLRGLLPFSLTKDQYDFVAGEFENVVARGGCGKKGSLVTVGHSLGAGLAQAAAFSNPAKYNPQVKYVFAFDPSPVTAWLEQTSDEVLERVRFLAIDRVYEVGEMLQAVRYVMQGFANPRVCQPRTRLVRFNRSPDWNPIREHGIDGLRKSFAELARNHVPRRNIRKLSEQKAQNCDFRDEVFR